MSVDEFEVAGRRVPGGVHVNYCSWASHRLPDLFPDPHAFKPERFAPEAKAALPKGAYVPFGGGSRTCIGMRFGVMEVKALAALILQRFSYGLAPGYETSIRQTPTLGPRDGMPIVVQPRTRSVTHQRLAADGTGRDRAGPRPAGDRARQRAVRPARRARAARLHARRLRRRHLRARLDPHLQRDRRLRRVRAHRARTGRPVGLGAVGRLRYRRSAAAARSGSCRRTSARSTSSAAAAGSASRRASAGRRSRRSRRRGRRRRCRSRGSCRWSAAPSDRTGSRSGAA